MGPSRVLLRVSRAAGREEQTRPEKAALVLLFWDRSSRGRSVISLPLLVLETTHLWIPDKGTASDKTSEDLGSFLGLEIVIFPSCDLMEVLQALVLLGAFLDVRVFLL